MKTVEEIYQELLAAFAERAGFTPNDSCDLAVRLYAAAAQLQALSIQADWVLDQSFPQTASGIYLDYHAAMRGIQRTGATYAQGVLRFFVDSASAVDLTVESGTVCLTAAETRFEATTFGTLPAGSLYVDVPARAVAAGASGNAAPGTVTILTACPVGITGCTNPAAFAGGGDAEDDESLRTRILDSYQRLPNGANAAFYEATALSHGAVAAAKAVGRARGIGTVDVYVATPAGLPDAALLEEIREDLGSKREIAVDVAVLAPGTLAVDVSLELSVEEGADFAAVQTASADAVRRYFTGELLGCPVRLAELGSLIFAVDGVENYHILSPAADVAGGQSVLPVLGALTVTEMGEA